MTACASAQGNTQSRRSVPEVSHGEHIHVHSQCSNQYEHIARDTSTSREFMTAHMQ